MHSVIAWLLDGDVSIQYMTHRYLLYSSESVQQQLRQRIPQEGFGAHLLSCRSANGHWGQSYYQPKWTSTHYTLLEMKNLYAPETLEPCREMITRMFLECSLDNGGLNLAKSARQSDVCVDGMILNYASYFCPDEPGLDRLVAFLLSEQKPDGGFSWDLSSYSGDPHTTICVLEGFTQYRASVGRNADSIRAAAGRAVEFLLKHELYFHNADERFQKLTYPYRYRYDLLRVLEFFVTANVPYDARMRSTVEWLMQKRHTNGFWYLEHQHKGNVHFVLEETGKPSRFITLKALVILEYFKPFAASTLS